MAAYLKAVHAEAVERSFNFNAAKIGRQKLRGEIKETRGQLLYEWRHLKRKLKTREPKRLRELVAVKIPAPHPLFKIIPGRVCEWEKVM